MCLVTKNQRWAFCNLKCNLHNVYTFFVAQLALRLNKVNAAGSLQIALIQFLTQAVDEIIFHRV